MAPDQRGEVGDVVVADIHTVRPDLAKGLLHVDGIPMHAGIEREAKRQAALPVPAGADFWFRRVRRDECAGRGDAAMGDRVNEDDG
jgi:hypothetical protein